MTYTGWTNFAMIVHYAKYFSTRMWPLSGSGPPSSAAAADTDPNYDTEIH